LSHGDLNPKNIILLDEQDGSVSVSGIVDWEMGGWYPEYWDALKALHVRSTKDESDWWCSLPEQFNQYVSEVAINNLIEVSTT
jgi:thiamine kinase-like enzyme